VKEYDLFVPLYHNDGTPDEVSGLAAALAGALLRPDIYRDEIVIYRVLTSKPRAARRFLLQLKAELKRELRQEEILIVERDVDTV